MSTDAAGVAVVAAGVVVGVEHIHILRLSEMLSLPYQQFGSCGFLLLLMWPTNEPRYAVEAATATATGAAATTTMNLHAAIASCKLSIDKETDGNPELKEVQSSNDFVQCG